MIVNEKVLRQVLREVAITGDATAGMSGRDDKQGQSTIPRPLPISPSTHMSTQLSVERPPVEDPAYIPMNPIELGRALAVVAETVKPEDVKKFYLTVLKLIDKLGEKPVVGESRKREK